MGMDASARKYGVSFNWTGWSELQRLLSEHGFKGKLPNSNDGEMVSRRTAQGVARAMLKFYDSKPLEDGKLPALSRHEAACLAYALLLVTHDGRVKHF